MRMSKTVGMLLGLVSMVAVPAAARAWEPTQPIQIIVGFAPGGGTDQTARLIAAAAQNFFPVPLVVVNRPGASGTLAAETVAKAKPDGYTLLVAGGSESTSVPNFMKTNYNVDQFRGIVRVNREHMVIVTKKGGGLDSIAAIVKKSKANPGTLAFGSSGPSSIKHAAFLVFEKAAGITMQHIPYQGDHPALAAVLGGHVDMTLITPNDAAAQVAAGNVHAVATTSDRAPQLPDVPCLKELGYDVNLENMKGLVVPAATPDEIANYLEDHFTKAMQSETFKTLAARANIIPGYLSGDDFENAMKNMSASIAAAIGKDAKAKK